MKLRLIAGLLAMLLPALAAAEEPRLTIEQLYSQTPERCSGSFWANGETIAFDAPVYVPHVREMPVLRVRQFAPDDAIDDRLDGQTLKRDPIAYEISNIENESLKQMFGDVRMVSDTQAYIGQLWSMEKSALHAVCAEKREETLWDQLEYMQRMTKAFAGKKEIGFIPEHVYVQSCWRERTRGGGIGAPLEGGPIAGLGGYSIDGMPTLRGIAQLYGISYAYEAGWAHDESNGTYPYLPLRRMPCISLYDYGEAYRMFEMTWCWQECGVAAADIPLCSFETILSAFEGMFEGSRVCRVESLRLGYVFFLDPKSHYAGNEDDLRAQYLAVPMWVADVEYAARSGGGGLDRVYMVNAQTGEPVDRRATGLSRWDAPAILPWK
ncbi:MAG: hypothetical protein IJ313_08100 [Clostridia bacterium]|nr:hypothetical protein [Clostridia bacterium]